THPYRWPVIGVEPDHIARVTTDDAHAWHSAHYSPDKAVLSVVGNIPAERVFEMAEHWFGHIPPCPSEPRALVDDPWPATLQVKTVYDNVPNPAIFIAYRMDPYGHRGYFAADAITDILSAGKSARMYQRLMMGTDLFAMAQASITGSEHSGMLLLAAYLHEDTDEAIDRAMHMLIAECEQLAEPGNVTPYELERTKNRYESTFVFENVNTISRAQSIALAVMHGEDVNDCVPRYRSLTLDDISSTGRRLFIDHKPAAVIFRPNKK
ncbi:MAG: insulinase family protein, partial [Muribaculaceae bacterium]|nr:insulinase family protein [Muribaculaceae bacterium]